MKTFKNLDANGELVSFEVRNIGRSHVCWLVEQRFAPAKVLRRKDDDFGLFELAGRQFVISEPWGDNSRYLIHELDPQPSAELNHLEAALGESRPSFWKLAFSGDRTPTRTILVLAIVLVGAMVAVMLLNRR